MKRFLLFTLVATMFAACVTDETQDIAVNIETPETLTVSFEEESRIQLQNGKTVWTKGDLVSVFYRSNANQKWQFQGETGERSGNLKRVADADATQELSDIVVVYPYNENYYINPRTCKVQASLPATQTYLANSYGLDGNIMISSSEYNQFALKSVCGWLKVQLTGNGEKVKSIALKGNNGEQVAGEIYINSADATCVLAAENGLSGDDSIAGGNLVFDDTILTEVVLNCGEGVTLGSTAKAFYIALPPQTFEKGLTIDIEATNGSKMTKSTSNAIVIERNTIQPMSVFVAEFAEPAQPNNEIWYTSTDGAIVTPYKTDVFGANIISNTYENGKGIIKFDTPITSIGALAFYQCASLTSVIIPNSATSIGGSAFNICTSLTSVTIPEGVTSIGGYAFNGCNNMTELTLPQSITSFGGTPFEGCTGRLIVRCNIPSSSYSYEKDRYPTFYNADFTEIIIEECVTSLKDNAFRFCRSLLNVYIKATTPPTLGANAFDGNATGRKIYVPYNSIEQYYAANNWSNYLLTPYDFENNKAYEIEQNPITYDWYTNATDGVYYISTPEELVAFSKLTNGDTEALAAVGAESSINFGGKVINLVADINLNNHCSVLAGSWTPIKSFAGTFNGNNHTISNLFIKSTENAGLFASVGSATIKNLTVQGEITCTSAKDVGGIAATAWSTLFENCISKVNISTSTTNMGTCVGGICGWSNEAKFIACQSTGNVHDKIEEWEWYNYVGGIVGYNADRTIFIACCKLSGSVKELNSQSYSAVGGILGIYHDSSSRPIIRSCYTSISVGGREPGYITNTAGYRCSSANIADCYYSGSNYKGIGTNRYGGSDYSYDLGTAKSTDIAAEIVIMNNGIDEWNAANPDCVCNYKYELDENNILKLTKQTTN